MKSIELKAEPVKIELYEYNELPDDIKTKEFKELVRVCSNYNREVSYSYVRELHDYGVHGGTLYYKDEIPILKLYVSYCGITKELFRKYFGKLIKRKYLEFIEEEYDMKISLKSTKISEDVLNEVNIGIRRLQEDIEKMVDSMYKRIKDQFVYIETEDDANKFFTDNNIYFIKHTTSDNNNVYYRQFLYIGDELLKYQNRFFLHEPTVYVLNNRGNERKYR